MTPFWKSPAITKRHKFIICSAVLAAILAGIFWFHVEDWGILLMLVSVYAATVWAFEADFKREEWIVVPLYLLLASSVAYSWLTLYAESWPLVVGGVVVYGFGMYVLYLTLNIINLATVRALPLARTATTVLGMAGLCCSFSLFYLSLVNQPPILNWAVTAWLISFLIAWPLLWSSMPAKGRLPRSLAWSALVSTMMAQLAAVSSFWPSSFMSSLVIAGMLFSILGLIHHQERRQLTKLIQRQYYLLGGVLLLIFYLATQWQ